VAPQGISEPIADVSTAHDRTAESDRFERIEAARQRSQREHARRQPPAPLRSRPRPSSQPDDDCTVGTRLDVVA
jgi:hypothetical protein